MSGLARHAGKSETRNTKYEANKKYEITMTETLGAGQDPIAGTWPRCAWFSGSRRFMFLQFQDQANPIEGVRMMD